MELYINLSRFHPLLVHLPIGILLFVFFMEGYQRWKKTAELEAAIRLGLLIGMLSAVGAMATGLSLANEGGYDVSLLNWHKWMGIGLGVLSGLLYWTKMTHKSWLSKLYPSIFIAVIALLFGTGHYGGNLTHGVDYLFTNGQSEAITVTDIQTANVYQTIIQPILKNKCNGCHNPSKAKGQLIMTTEEGILKGGENGSLFNFEQPEKSEFLVRVHLPMTEKKHMPPKGKKQLEEDEINLLTWWIQNKACFDCLVKDMEATKAVEPLLQRYKSAESNLEAIKVEPLKAETIDELNKAGIRVSPISETSPLVFVDLSNHQNLDNTLLKKVKNIGQNVIELNLANSNFSDIHASIFSSLPHLQKLQLQHTDITDRTVAKLSQLEYLASLNLYKTAITDAALSPIANLKALKKLYTWQTNISNAAMADFQQSKPLVQVQYQFDEDIFGKSELLAPTFMADSQLFNDSVTISFEINFRNTTIYYTLDGSEPDSTSTIFKDSIVLKSSARVKAFVAKTGWDNSEITTQQFIKTGYKLVNAKLNSPPNEKYRANGAATLIDLKKGTTSFSEGTWLGYEGQHFTATLEMKKAAPIQSIFVSALSAPGSWIFYPQGFTVSVSENGKSYKTIYDKMLPPLKEDMEGGMEYFDIHFTETNTRFIKVKVHSLLKNPKWHPAPGQPCWLFVDEIMVN